MLFNAGTVFERMLNSEKLTIDTTEFTDYAWDSETNMSTFKFGEGGEVRVLIEAPINENWQHKNYSLWDAA